MVITLTVGPIRTNCYLIFDEETRDGVVIDPGDDSGRILDAIHKNGLKVGYILLTHGHFDHVLAVNDVKQETGAKLVIHQKDAPRLKASRMEEYKPFLKGKYKEPTPDFLAQDGDKLKFGSIEATYLSTPGHTPGSCVIMVGDILFTGDTLFYRQCGRCDLPGGDYDQMLHSLKKLALLPGDYTVYPGHEEKSTLASERIHNPYIREAMDR